MDIHFDQLRTLYCLVSNTMPHGLNRLQELETKWRNKKRICLQTSGSIRKSNDSEN